MKKTKKQIKNNSRSQTKIVKLGSAARLTRGGGNAEIESIRIGVYYK